MDINIAFSRCHVRRRGALHRAAAMKWRLAADGAQAALDRLLWAWASERETRGLPRVKEAEHSAVRALWEYLHALFMLALIFSVPVALVCILAGALGFVPVLVGLILLALLLAGGRRA